MQRPRGIEITTWLIALALAVEAIQTVILWNSTVALHATKDFPLQEALNATRGFYVFMISVSTLALSFYWKGRERARRIILVDCVLCLFRLTSLMIPEIRKISLFNEVAIYCQAGLAIFLLGYLFTPTVRTWFTESTKTDTTLYPVSPTPVSSESDRGINYQMHRPKGVEITTWLMIFFMIGGTIRMMLRWNEIPTIAPPPSLHLTSQMASLIFDSILVASLVLTIAVVYFYWKGRDWARALVLLDSAFSIFGLRRTTLYWKTSHFNAIEAVLSAILAAFLLWYLFRPEVRAWFAEQTKLAAPNRALKPATL